jgi:hypothetical protein
MSYLYGIRFKMEENDLICSLREVRIHMLTTGLAVTDILCRSYTRPTTTAYTGQHSVTTLQAATFTHLTPPSLMP